MLYGPAISQSHCRKGSPYQLPCNNYTKENSLAAALVGQGNYLIRIKVFGPEKFITGLPKHS